MPCHLACTLGAVIATSLRRTRRANSKVAGNSNGSQLPSSSGRSCQPGRTKAVTLPRFRGSHLWSGDRQEFAPGQTCRLPSNSQELPEDSEFPLPHPHRGREKGCPATPGRGICSVWLASRPQSGRGGCPGVLAQATVVLAHNQASLDAGDWYPHAASVTGRGIDSALGLFKRGGR